jgi:hypothetical protein
MLLSNRRTPPFPPQFCVRTLPAGIKRAHIEDIHALHLSKNFQTLETSGLLEIGRHGTGLSTLGDKVSLGSDLCGSKVLAESILSRRLEPHPESTAGRLATFNGAATASGRNERAAYGRKASCAWRARRAWGRRGCRCRLSQCQPMPSYDTATPPNLLPVSALAIPPLFLPQWPRFIPP